MPTPQTIKIFLMDGEPDGLKSAELSNWVGQAIVIPRNKFKEVKSKDGYRKPAVYFLIGRDAEESALPTVYVGEAENLVDRLSFHNTDPNMEFWQLAIAFIKKDDNLTKAHVKYLESRCQQTANEVKRCKMKNTKESSEASLYVSDKAEMEEFLGHLALLLSALGYPFLQKIIAKETKNSHDPLFYCQGKGAKATGRMTNDGFVVYAGSTAAVAYSKAVEEKNPRVFALLEADGYIERQSADLYRFVKDYVFTSPSAASDIILGNSSNGWVKWKDSDGKTLEEVYRD